MSHKHFHLNPFAESKLKGSLEYGAEIGAKTRIRLDSFDLSPTDFERQNPCSVHDLFGKVDLKMTDNFPAGLPPAAHRRERHVFQ
jgi:hypothetical protein